MGPMNYPYGNNQPNYMNPYFNNTTSNIFNNPNINNTTFLPKSEIIKVNGKGGAEAYQMGVNSSALLLDETAPIVWLKTTDGAGYPSLSAYSIAPYQPEKPIDTKSLDDRISRLETIIYEQQSYNSRNGNKYDEPEHGSGGKSTETSNGDGKRTTKS